MTKPRILEAVREAEGKNSAQLIDHLKKAEMAKEAERLLEGAASLPGPLRTPESAADTPIGGETAGEDEAMPAFLAGDEESAGGQRSGTKLPTQSGLISRRGQTRSTAVTSTAVTDVATARSRSMNLAACEGARRARTMCETR